MSEKWSQLGAKLFSETTVGPNTLAEFYLNGRGIRLTSWPAALRFHPAADHPKLKQRFPAMIAQVVGASEPSFQITYLTTDGRKAEIDKEDQRRHGQMPNDSGFGQGMCQKVRIDRKSVV